MPDRGPSDTRCSDLQHNGSHVQRGRALGSRKAISTDGLLLNTRHSAEGGNENEKMHTNYRCAGNVGNNGC